jgi:hypothetical protein
MNALKTSIVITNYNYGRFVARCIDSALAQSYRDTEVVAWTMPREIILGKPSRAMGRAYSRYCKSTTAGKVPFLTSYPSSFLGVATRAV